VNYKFKVEKNIKNVESKMGRMGLVHSSLFNLMIIYFLFYVAAKPHN